MSFIYFSSYVLIVFLHLSHKLMSSTDTFIDKSSNISALFFKPITFDLLNPKRKCDSLLYPNSKCDLKFEVCLSRNTRSVCDIDKLGTSQEYHLNIHSLTFDQSFAGLRLPIRFALDSITDLKISVRITDVDVFNHDFLGQIYLDLDHLVAHRHTESLIPKDAQMKSSKAHSDFADLHLDYYLWAECKNNYYGPSCIKHCIPTNEKEEGHYGCDLESGEKVCITGWTGENCNTSNVCIQKRPCSFTSDCVTEGESFRCVCHDGFSGLLCNIVDNPCHQKGRRPTGGEKSSNPCRNHGLCQLQYDSTVSHPVEHCVCRPGFTGANCDYDIDECAQWDQARVESVECLTPGHVARPCCGPHAVCRNTFGSYQCQCPQGWTGSNCQFPPSVWPKGALPSTNQTIAMHGDASGGKPLNVSVLDNLILHSPASSSTIVLASLLFILLLALLVATILVVVWYHRRKRSRHEMLARYLTSTGMLMHPMTQPSIYMPSSPQSPYQLTLPKRLALPAPPPPPRSAFANDTYHFTFKTDKDRSSIYDDLNPPLSDERNPIYAMNHDGDVYHPLLTEAGIEKSSVDHRQDELDEIHSIASSASIVSDKK